MVNLWGFGPEQIHSPPEAEEIENHLQPSGYRHIELTDSPPAIRKTRPRIYLDLSGIAKGYAVDAIAGHLYQLGIRNFLVDIGGEISARGRNSKNEFWRVGIEKPQVNGRSVQKIVTLKNTGLATSGDYRNFIVYDSKRFPHIIDPATGRPVSHSLVSVTVLDRSAMTADALSTALLVMGEEKAYRFAEETNIPALFISNKNGFFAEEHTASLSPYLPE